MTTKNEIEMNEKQEPGFTLPFTTKEELKLFIQMHIPLAVRPQKRSNFMFVSPFSSAHARDEVIDTLVDEIIELNK